MVHYLKRNEKTILQKHLKEVPESKIASLDYKIIKELNNYFALEIHTGRHHQIRTTFGYWFSYKGDLKYGLIEAIPMEAFIYMLKNLYTSCYKENINFSQLLMM
jgi:23S rRNA pseudouridine1911/1915/1917 synthase